MTKFRYRGKNMRGDEIQGVFEAENRSLVAAMIRARGYFPVYIKKDKTLISVDKVIEPGELSIFFRELGIMMKSGISLVDSIELLEYQTQNIGLKTTLGQVILDLKQGASLYEAFARHRGVLPDYAIKLMKIGEDTGTLEQVSIDLANYFEDRLRQTEKLKSAMIYPSIIIFISSIIFSVLTIKVLPVFIDLYHDAQVSLPWATQCLLWLSGNIKLIFIVILSVKGLVFLGLRKLQANPKGALEISKIKLKLPIIGALILHSQVGLFCDLLSLGLSSGLPLLEALDMTRHSLSSKALMYEVDKMRQGLKGGYTLSQVVDLDYFPAIFCQMVKSGEEAGNLEEILKNLARILQDKVDITRDRLFRLIEPTMVLLLSIFIGFMAMAVTGPMFNIYGLYF